MSTARLHRKRWSRWDDSLLATQHGRSSVATLANQLGRTPGAVRARARVRKLPAPRELLFAQEDILEKETLPTRNQASVELFMRLAGQATPSEPTVPDEATRLLRAKLLMEETLETIIHGLGVGVDYFRANGTWKFSIVNPPNMVEIADGVADMIVVATGTALACGIKLEPIQQLVDEANLAKFAPGATRREDGKWQKPPGWRPPKIAEELQRQGWKP